MIGHCCRTSIVDKLGFCLLLELCLKNIVVTFDLLLMKTFWHLWCWCVVIDDMMFSWYCYFPFSDFRNVVWCLIVEFLFSLIFFLHWFSRINAMLRVVFFDEYFCKVANLKLNFVESVICFEFWMLSGLRSLFFKAMLKVVVWRTAC